MRIKIVLGTCLIAVWGAFISVAAADDSNVIVDLSVLDRLSPAPQAVSAAPQPLFPVVKKSSASKKAVRQKTAKKAAAKKPAKVKVSVKEKTSAKVEIPAQAPAGNLAVPARSDTETAKTDTSAPDQVAPGLPAAQPLAPVIGVDRASQTSGSRTNPVVSENKLSPSDPAVSQNEAEVSSAETVPPAALPGREQVSLPVIVEEEKVEVVDVEPVAPKVPVLPEETAVSPDTAPGLPASAAPVHPASSETGLLVEDTVSAAPAHRLLFESGVSELSAGQQRQVDAIIASFKDPANNKIAIIAYNQDDGVDSFRKKRLSLDRVVKIRSYLLQKGYKDFAVKVINVDAKSDRGNVVEIEEM